MRPTYGSYSHGELGRVDIGKRVVGVFNDAQQLTSYVVQIELNGHLGGTATSAAMDTQVRNLYNAYAVQGRDFIVYLPGGSVASQLSLFNAGSLGGVRVVAGPTFPSLQNAAYVTWLPFSVTLEAEYPVIGAAGLYRNFEESVTYEGGGRVEGYLKPLNGLPVRQTLRQHDTYRATQSGSAVGYLARPAPPPPIWPAALTKNPQILLRSPQRRGNSYLDFYVGWTYEFESATPLIGVPHAWP